MIRLEWTVEPEEQRAGVRTQRVLFEVHNGSTMADVAEAMRSFAVAVGFHPAVVNAHLNGETDEPLTATAEDRERDTGELHIVP